MDTVLKRLKVTKEKNLKIDSHAKNLGLTHHEFINEAIDKYINSLEHPENEENVYTLRMNEMTAQLKRLEIEFSSGVERVLDAMDVNKTTSQGASYMNDFDDEDNE